MNGLIHVKLKEIINLEGIIKKNENVEKLIILVDIHYLLLLERYT